MARTTIIDDFLPIDVFKKIQKEVMHPEFPWFYIEHVSIAPEENDINDPLAVETDGYFHIVYDKPLNAMSYTHELFQPFYKKLEDLGYNGNQLVRSRLSVKHPRSGFTEQNYNLPHVDYHTPHDTIIFYLNDSDGDTHIFDQNYTVMGCTEGFTIKQKVTPKANRLLLIDGMQYHTASNPFKTQRRIVLNLNLE